MAGSLFTNYYNVELDLNELTKQGVYQIGISTQYTVRNLPNNDARWGLLEVLGIPSGALVQVYWTVFNGAFWRIKLGSWGNWSKL